MYAAFLRVLYYTFGNVFEVLSFFKTFNSFFLMLNKRPLMVCCDEKGRLILSVA